MSKAPSFDTQEAHKYYSAHCFNKTWEYIDKQSRTAADDQAMLHTCLASLWHWQQRSDATKQNLSVGYWQASRVFALLSRADDARTYGQRSLDLSGELEPFFQGYAYEALARSEMLANDRDKMAEYLTRAKARCDSVTDPDSKKLLAADLDTIK